MDAQARGREYWHLAADPVQKPFYYTYVKDVGYVDFHDVFEAQESWKHPSAPR